MKQLSSADAFCIDEGCQVVAFPAAQVVSPSFLFFFFFKPFIYLLMAALGLSSSLWPVGFSLAVLCGLQSSRAL